MIYSRQCSMGQKKLKIFRLMSYFLRSALLGHSELWSVLVYLMNTFSQKKPKQTQTQPTKINQDTNRDRVTANSF